jgi:hypothetical protein
VDIKQAKDFLAEQVAAQAALEGVSFSNLEKKMLHFTEVDSVSGGDGAALQDEFQTRHDATIYESKVSTLLHQGYERLKKDERKKIGTWDQAIRVLEHGDHYLLVLWDIIPPQERPARAVSGWSESGLFIVLLGTIATVIWLLFSNAR